MTSRPPAMEWHRGYVTRGTRSCTRIKSPVNASWSNARFHAKMTISSICGALCILFRAKEPGGTAAANMQGMWRDVCFVFVVFVVVRVEGKKKK